MESKCSKPDSKTFVGLLRVRLMFNSENIAHPMSLGLRDDHFGAMTSFFLPILHHDFS